MGLGPSKRMINEILEKQSANNVNINLIENTNTKIEYYKQDDVIDIEENMTNNSISYNWHDLNNDSFRFSTCENQTITSPLQNVKNSKKFPYIAIGTLIVRFPISNSDEYFTCFLIDANVVITLASNLEDKNKGGRAKSILTTFSEEKVKWENIFIQGEEEKKEKKKKNEQKSIHCLNAGSKLAAILYKDNIGSEWISVEGGKA